MCVCVHVCAHTCVRICVSEEWKGSGCIIRFYCTLATQWKSYTAANCFCSIWKPCMYGSSWCNYCFVIPHTGTLQFWRFWFPMVLTCMRLIGWAVTFAAHNNLVGVLLLPSVGLNGIEHFSKVWGYSSGVPYLLFYSQDIIFMNFMNDTTFANKNMNI